MKFMQTCEEVSFNFGAFFDSYLTNLKSVIDSIDINEVRNVVYLLTQCYYRKKFIYLFGNGGSGSTASHFVTDFNKVVCQNLQNKFKCICLNDNIPSLLAISNDISYDQVFKYQLQNYLTPGDLVIGISGSGNSKNVIEGIKYANSLGTETIGIVGFDGGILKKLARHSIHIPVNQMQYVEDAHLILNHLMGNILKHQLEGGSLDC